MKLLIFVLLLAPLIRINYWLRERHIIADQWFWADRVATGRGMFVQ